MPNDFFLLNYKRYMYIKTALELNTSYSKGIYLSKMGSNVLLKGVSFGKAYRNAYF